MLKPREIFPINSAKNYKVLDYVIGFYFITLT